MNSVCAIGSGLEVVVVYSSVKQTLAALQAAGSLARILGPIFAAPLFMTHPLLPYFTCAVIAILTGLITLRRLHTTGPRRASLATRA